MKVGIGAGYWAAGPPVGVEQQLAEAEALGVDSFWTAEAYGSDALTPLAWWGSRTSSHPARHVDLPAVGAHADGARDGRDDARPPLGRPRAPRDRRVGAPGRRGLVRPALPAAARAHARVRRDHARGDRARGARHLRRRALPAPAARWLGARQAAALDHPPVPPASIPILLGAEGPKNVALAAEIADGWLALWYSPKSDAFYRDALAEGFARHGAHATAACFEAAATVTLIEHDDVEVAASFLKPVLALYIGGMGAKGANFHHDVFVRMGWGDGLRGHPGRLPRGRPRRGDRAGSDRARGGRGPRRPGRQDRRGDRARRGARRASRR